MDKTNTTTHHNLTSGQIVQHPGKNYLGSQVTVYHTDIKRQEEYGDRPEFLEEIRQIARDNHHAEAFGIVESSMICADYPGKAEALRKKREMIAAAPVLNDGDTCEFENGEKFEIKLIQRHVSDCIHFKRIA